MISSTYFSFRIFVEYSCSPEVISDVNRMIEFLRKRGYTVLNLIEIRKPWQNEKTTQKIIVGEHEFDY